MGLRFRALLDLGAGFRSVEDLRARLANDPEPFEALLTEGDDRALTWRSEKSRFPGCFEVEGPGTFGLTVSSNAVNVFHWTRFAWFARDAAQRARVRRAVFVVARIIGADWALLSHELLPSRFFEGRDLAASERALRATIGPPATTWQELQEADDWGPRSWYLDDFADLRGR
jgi:hypothetical protein